LSSMALRRVLCASLPRRTGPSGNRETAALTASHHRRT
jgi:hypothetical protein